MRVAHGSLFPKYPHILAKMILLVSDWHCSVPPSAASDCLDPLHESVQSRVVLHSQLKQDGENKQVLGILGLLPTVTSPP